LQRVRDSPVIQSGTVAKEALDARMPMRYTDEMGALPAVNGRLTDGRQWAS